MINSFTVENFRCFNSLTIDRLARINLIAGKNNSGKTSLLEALLLQSNPNGPAVPSLLNMHRGLPYVFDPDDLWGWLFYNKDTGATISFQADYGNGSRQLRLRLEVATESLVQPPPTNGTDGAGSTTSLLAPPRPRQLLLYFTDEHGRNGTASAFATLQNVQSTFANVEPYVPGFYSILAPNLTAVDADRFSRLEEIGRGGEILDGLRTIEPRLTRLVPLFTGGQPVFHGDIGIGRLVPLPVMGEGVVRLAQILIGIAFSHTSSALIDEIENGLHHTVVESVWTAIADAARRADVQVFATTHSWECITAAHKAFEKCDEGEFALHRLSTSRKTGKISVTTYDRETLAAALEGGFEVR